jgi:hypothetical protein
MLSLKIDAGGNLVVGRHEISAELTNAKQAAIERLFAGTRAPRHSPVGAVRTHPEHNVVGIGIGRKFTGGKATRTACVRIYVEHKVSRESLPENLLLPESVGGVVTDVIETGRFRAFLPDVPDGQKRLRPAKPGCSIGFQFTDVHAGNLMAGTLGALVEADGVHYILSNNHVLANENALPVGTPIFQPGILDRGDITTDQIATLTRFIPLKSDGPNRVDCALAALLDATSVSPAILPKIGQLTSAEPIDAVESMQVAKTGRATGYTTGTVLDVSATITVEFSRGMLTFEDQLLIRSNVEAFSEFGDSGALVVDRGSGRATGLLVGGARRDAIANHVGDVLQALNVKLVC